MSSEREKSKRWQFELSTLMLLVLAVALICANVVPRYSTVGSDPEFVVKHWYRGFPFVYAEDVESPTERLGKRNLAALAGDMLVTGIVLALLVNRQLFRRNRAAAINGRT